MDYYVDGTNGSNSFNGSSPSTAWKTIEYALESGNLSYGDNVWCRRTINEIPTTDIEPTCDGASNSPISIIGWPRGEATGTITFTNGSTSLMSSSLPLYREKHLGRKIKNDADGKWYLITKVDNTSTCTIDREYAGNTVVNASFTIQKDDDYDNRPSDGVSAGWDSDSDDLPVIDFNDGDYQLKISADSYLVFKNLEIKDSSDINGIVWMGNSKLTSLIGCLIKQSSSNSKLLRGEYQDVYLERIIIEASNGGTNQIGFSFGTSCTATMKDTAIYNCGTRALCLDCNKVFLENVNLGVEMPNASPDIWAWHSCFVHGRDVKLGGTNGDVLLTTTYGMRGEVKFENYNKILGAHKAFYVWGTVEKVLADGSGTHPNRRSGGGQYVIEVTPNISGYEQTQDGAVEIFTHEYESQSTQKTWRYYVQNYSCGNLSSTQIWLKLEYVDSFDDTSEYTITTVLSDESVVERTSNTDWSQYIEVPSITPATSSKVRIKCYVSIYDSDGRIYIDPKVENP